MKVSNDIYLKNLAYKTKAELEAAKIAKIINNTESDLKIRMLTSLLDSIEYQLTQEEKK